MGILDAENSYLAEGLTEAGAVEELTGSSITYRIAVGQILSHVEAKQTCNRQQAGDLPTSRAPPPFG